MIDSSKRRDVLRGICGAGGVAISGCLGGGGTSTPTTTTDDNQNGATTTTTPGEPRSLSIAAPGFSFPDEEPVGKSLKEQYNIELEHKPIAQQPQDTLNLFVAGDGQNNFDVVYDNGGGMEDLLASRDVIVPLEKDRIDNWGDVYHQVKKSNEDADMVRYEDTLYGVPVYRSNDGISYLSEEIPEGIDSWGALFSEEFKGEVGILNDYSYMPHIAALYLKENDMADIDNQSNLTEDELETVIDFLIERKQDGQFQSIWSGLGETISDLQNGEVLLGTVLIPAIPILKAQGTNVEIGACKEGAVVWYNLWMMTSGARDRNRQDAFYDMVDWGTSPKYGADLVATQGVMPGLKNDVVKDYVEAHPDQYDVDFLTSFIDGFQKRGEFGGPGARLNVYPSNLEAYFDEWERFMNA